MPADKISIDKAKKNKLFYVVANVVIYHPLSKKCLVLKRHPREIAHPNKYAVPGGKHEWTDLPIDSPTRINGDILDYESSIEKLLAKEVKEETNLEISQDLHYLNSVSFIRPDNIPVLLIKFAAKYESGQVILEENSFTDYKWVDSEEAKQLDCIEGIPEEIQKTIELFKD